MVSCGCETNPNHQLRLTAGLRGFCWYLDVFGLHQTRCCALWSNASEIIRSKSCGFLRRLAAVSILEIRVSWQPALVQSFYNYTDTNVNKLTQTCRVLTYERTRAPGRTVMTRVRTLHTWLIIVKTRGWSFHARLLHFINVLLNKYWHWVICDVIMRLCLN